MLYLSIFQLILRIAEGKYSGQKSEVSRLRLMASARQGGQKAGWLIRKLVKKMNCLPLTAYY
jgi:hypothetical protein